MAIVITPEYLHKFFKYKDGMLFWKQKTSNLSRVNVGGRAGSSHVNGYRITVINLEQYQEHRIVWMMHYGEIPADLEIDHIDLNRSNNKIENLRLATRSQNLINSGIRSHNKTGYKGVYFNSKLQKWVSSIRLNRKSTYLGAFASKEDAANAYNEAALRLHGEFANINNVKIIPQ